VKIVVLILLGLILPFSAFIGWQKWRDHRVISFCHSIHVGLPIAELLKLEKQYGIDRSYLMEDFDQQARELDLVFRSHMLDPDFECSISHNGEVVTSAGIFP
jgi:hypothetical protein